MNVHKLPVVSVGQLVYTPADGYKVQSPRVEFGVGRPTELKKKKERERERDSTVNVSSKNLCKLSSEYWVNSHHVQKHGCICERNLLEWKELTAYNLPHWGELLIKDYMKKAQRKN